MLFVMQQNPQPLCIGVPLRNNGNPSTMHVLEHFHTFPGTQAVLPTFPEHEGGEEYIHASLRKTFNTQLTVLQCHDKH